MADVLSQNEVDALLAAVSSPGTRQTARASEGVRYYDFLRPERVSGVEMRALSDLHEFAARCMAASLGGALRTAVDCRLQSFDQLSWGEFAMGLPNPTCFAVVRARRGAGGRGRPFTGRFVLEINPAILYPMIDRLLGAPPGGAWGAPARALTAIETRVAGRLVEMLLGALAEVWGRAGEIELKLEQIETNPQLAPVAAPAEMSALATFEVTLSSGAERGGMIHVCMPLGEFRTLFAELTESSRCEASAENAARNALLGVPLRVEAFIAWKKIPLRRILELEPGDTIGTTASPSDELVVTVGGKAKLRATAGDFLGRKAFRVTGRLDGPPVGFPEGGAES